MRKFIGIAAIFAAVALLSATAFAQGPGGPGGFQPSPQMRAQFQAWRSWRDNHKNVVALQQTLRGLQEIEQDPSTRLNKVQAHKVLAVLVKWKDKPAIKDAQARIVSQQLTAPLNVTQLQKLAAAMQRRGFGGGPGGPRPGGMGGPRPGGFGGPGGGRPGGFTLQAPHDYNPLNPNTLPFPPMRVRAAQNMSQLIAALKATK